MYIFIPNQSIAENSTKSENQNFNKNFGQKLKFFHELQAREDYLEKVFRLVNNLLTLVWE